MFKVKDEYRTNPLSHETGGYSVVAVMHRWAKGPRMKEYINVKNTKIYIARTLAENPEVERAYVKPNSYVKPYGR